MLSYAEMGEIVNRWDVQMRVTRLRNLKLLAYGIMQGRSGCLSTIVRQWPLGSRRHTHRLKRLHRFLSDYEWEVNLVSEGLAKVAMRFRPGGMRSKHLPIAIDWTKVHDFTVLSAAMPRRKRAIPLAHGVYLPGELRHSQNKLEVGMCTMVASWVPAELRPLFLADAGLGRTEFIRWLQQYGFAYVVRIRPDTTVAYDGYRGRLGDIQIADGAVLLLSQVAYRDKSPVVTNIVISRMGDKTWYLATSFSNPHQTVNWYKKRFWIEEMFRDLKSTLGLRKAAVRTTRRLERLLLGYQLAYLLLYLIGAHLPSRWQSYMCSKHNTSPVWRAIHALPLLFIPRYRKTWFNRIWPTLRLETG